MSPKFSKPSCQVQPKPNSAPFTSTPVEQSQCETSLRKWATSNLPCPYKPTTALPTVLLRTTFNHVAPKRWTCDSTGNGAVTPKANSDTTGDLGLSTEPTIGPNTIVLHITLRYAPQF